MQNNRKVMKLNIVSTWELRKDEITDCKTKQKLNKNMNEDEKDKMQLI